jgi:hypothetical protein
MWRWSMKKIEKLDLSVYLDVTKPWKRPTWPLKKIVNMILRSNPALKLSPYSVDLWNDLEREWVRRWQTDPAVYFYFLPPNDVY